MRLTIVALGIIASALLLASCGTHQHSVGSALRNPRCQWCSDISRWSPQLMEAFFDHQSDVLVPDDFRRCCNVGTLKLSLDWLKQNPSRQIVITGYCDRIEGTDAALARLDLRRAEAMRAYFVKQGIAHARITAFGGGALQEDGNEMQLAIQRRAEPTEVPPR